MPDLKLQLREFVSTQFSSVVLSAGGVDLTAVAGAVGFSGRKSYRVHGPPKPSSTTVIVCKARGLGYLQMHTALLY